MIPEIDLARLRRWVDARNADLHERARGLICYELDVTDRNVTNMERRPPWRSDYGPEWTTKPRDDGDDPSPPPAMSDPGLRQTLFHVDGAEEAAGSFVDGVVYHL